MTDKKEKKKTFKKIFQLQKAWQSFRMKKVEAAETKYSFNHVWTIDGRTMF